MSGTMSGRASTTHGPYVTLRSTMGPSPATEAAIARAPPPGRVLVPIPLVMSTPILLAPCRCRREHDRNDDT